VERTEAALVHRYRRHLASLGHEVSRLRVVPPGQGSPIYSDLWDGTAHQSETARLFHSRRGPAATKAWLVTAVRMVGSNRPETVARVATRWLLQPGPA